MFIKKALFMRWMKKYFLIDFIFVMHIQWSKTLDILKNGISAHQICAYLANYWFSYYEARTVKFGSVGAFNTLIKLRSGFCDNLKIIFMLIII